MSDFLTYYHEYLREYMASQARAEKRRADTVSAFLLDSTEDIEAAIRGEVRGTDNEDLDQVERAPRPRKVGRP